MSPSLGRERRPGPLRRRPSAMGSRVEREVALAAQVQDGEAVCGSRSARARRPVTDRGQRLLQRQARLPAPSMRRRSATATWRPSAKRGREAIVRRAVVLPPRLRGRDRGPRTESARPFRPRAPVKVAQLRRLRGSRGRAGAAARRPTSRTGTSTRPSTSTTTTSTTPAGRLAIESTWRRPTRPGIYAARLTTADCEDLVPFFVTDPGRPRPPTRSCCCRPSPTSPTPTSTRSSPIPPSYTAFTGKRLG